MALTYTDLLEVDLGKLGTAVSDWKKSVDALRTAADNAAKGMRAKSDAARWAGANASVTREFVTKTTKEIADLHAEADSIHKVLLDGHTELVALQKNIRTAVQQDAPNLGIRVEDIGEGKVRCFFPHVRGDTDERTQDQLDARQELEDRINRTVAHASEIDAPWPVRWPRATAATSTTPVTGRTSPWTTPRPSGRPNWPSWARR